MSGGSRRDRTLSTHRCLARGDRDPRGGGHYARAALDAGFSLQALARNVDKLSFSELTAVTAIQGDATSIDDVAQLIDRADVVVSCVGNPNKETHIMEATANNVLEAAGR
jgi:putative NADH-flavin reductase